MHDLYFPEIDFNVLKRILEDIFSSQPAHLAPRAAYRNPAPSAPSKPAENGFAGKYVSTVSDIPVKRVTYSGKKTVVWFVDGSKTIVTCSSNDKYDRQTAIAYALVKRIFGKIDPKTGIAEGNGLGLKLDKIAASGYDQEAEEKKAKAKKAAAHAEHVARQKAQSEAAFQRKAKARAEQLRIERAAQRILDEEDAKSRPCNCGKAVLNECASASKKAPGDGGKAAYVKPDKPFSKFTQEEKRAYWRNQSAIRRSKKQ